jgi:hypothetical protein
MTQTNKTVLFQNKKYNFFFKETGLINNKDFALNYHVSPIKKWENLKNITNRVYVDYQNKGCWVYENDSRLVIYEFDVSAEYKKNKSDEQDTLDSSKLTKLRKTFYFPMIEYSCLNLFNLYFELNDGIVTRDYPTFETFMKLNSYFKRASIALDDTREIGAMSSSDKKRYYKKIQNDFSNEEIEISVRIINNMFAKSNAHFHYAIPSYLPIGNFDLSVRKLLFKINLREKNKTNSLQSSEKDFIHAVNLFDETKQIYSNLKK